MEGRVRTAIIKSKYILYPQPNVNLIDWIIIWLLSTYILSLIDIFWNNIDSLKTSKPITLHLRVPK